ncbi:uncharacterized protein LOC123559195 [Mercenaria mercenaria]|uniref:uncharacterized protein LOC123559195 n=1 Tax=Mercenaria mercenaria TaxID=6596 RepID=UPI00234FABB0|nr:uncharacterized protein LOC123559195 [Mercenaria mercenaria]
MKLQVRVLIWICICLPFGILFSYYLTQMKENPKQHISQTYSPFQSAEEVEFPTTENEEPRIPHIIHQMSCNGSVPEPYRGLIETFTKQNPKWTYRFWTHESGRRFLVDHYPYLVDTYDVFGKCNAKQLDMIKYAVLHEFGGVYADFDMENIRPLDKATLKYGCIIPIEPIENAAMRLQDQMEAFRSDLFKNIPTYIKLNVNVMLCRPKHPFLTFLLTNLKDPINPFGNHEHVSGAEFVTNSYKKFNGIDLKISGKRVTNHASNSPNFYKGNRTEDSKDTVYIPNSQYFFDSVDPVFLDAQGNLKNCLKFEEKTYKSSAAKQACAEFEWRRKVRKNKKYTFTIHHWHDSKVYNFDKWLGSQERIHIQQIVPGCVFYK